MACKMFYEIQNNRKMKTTLSSTILELNGENIFKSSDVQIFK